MVKNEFDDELLEHLRDQVLDCTDSEKLVQYTEAYNNACKGQAELNDSIRDIDEKREKFDKIIRIVEVSVSVLGVGALYFGPITARLSNIDGIYAQETLQKFVDGKFFKPIKTRN